MSNSPLQKAPRGLLELLRLRTLGDQPYEFGSALEPGIDCTPFYASDLQKTLSFGPSVGSLVVVGGLEFTAIPVNPILVYGIGGQLTLGAAPGTYVEWSVGLRLPQATAQPCILATGRKTALIAAQVIPFGSSLSVPIICPAGGAIYVQCKGDGAGADHSLLITDLIADLNPNA